ncbi:MAG: hypothetical protein AAF467_07425 [Actinomycetota bacterium]
MDPTATIFLVVMAVTAVQMAIGVAFFARLAVVSPATHRALGAPKLLQSRRRVPASNWAFVFRRRYRSLDDRRLRILGDAFLVALVLVGLGILAVVVSVFVG